MKILHIKLVNFVGVLAAMGLHEIEFTFGNIDKPIIQLYGKNRCGKTVLIQQLHPFSSINLSGDERSDLNLIIPGENGIKEISYELNGDVYYITHFYKATNKAHTISSSIKKNGEELNENGGVNTFNQLIESIFGINKYRFQFVINGTQLTSFANMTGSQRKTLLNKAMGIDIYDKIHKLATDDYRYTNKLILSLSNTQEYLLKTYGSYDSLCTRLKQCEDQCNELEREQLDIRSRMDHISGKLQTLRSQNPSQEYMGIQRRCDAYLQAVQLFDGNVTEHLYDELVNEQIRLNQHLSELKSEYTILIRDIDDSYSKQHEIETQIAKQKRTIEDIKNMESMIKNLETKIHSINIIDNSISASSDYYRSMINLAQAINSICNEIVNCLSEQQLQLFSDMIQKDIDIAAFIIREGSVLMDTEREKSAITRIQTMLENIQGDEPTECLKIDCLYRKTYDTLNQYFKSYHSTIQSQFTTYDMEQFDHAHKNIQTINRLLNPNQITDDLREMFSLKTIIKNLVNGMTGVDVKRLTFLMEEAARIEMRDQYIKQLSDARNTLDSMKSIIPSFDNSQSDKIMNDIQIFQSKKDTVKDQIQQLTNQIDENDKKRLILSDIKNIDINTLNKRKHQLESVIQQIETSDTEYHELSLKFQEVSSQLSQAQQDYDVLQQANQQYMKTVSEIDFHTSNDSVYKAIAEATSSTKGKPVITIRDTVHHALNMTNQLLHVMYQDEIKLLEPIIDENEFTLPFRCGFNNSSDIRYGSQSESTLLSLALSLSLASTMIPDIIPLVDEIDAYLDLNAKDGFVMMLQEMMIKLNVEQLFVISHSVSADQYSRIVHTVDISEQIEQLKKSKN